MSQPEYFLLRPEVEKAYGYSHAVKIGHDIKISGAVSMDDAGNPTAIGDIGQQMKNVYSDLGKILDPMADSIMRVCVFLTFTQGVVQLPILLIFVFVYRDAVIGTLRTLCALKGHALAARKTGKIKAVIQAVAAFTILILMIPHSLGHISTYTLQTASACVVGFACAYSIYSGTDYIIANRHYLKKMLICPKKVT